jgi:hypothetical protein
VKYRTWISALTLAVLVAATASAQEPKKQPISFGTLDAVSADTVKTQAQAWLKDAGKTGMNDQFEAIWKHADRPVLDRLADSFALGSADAAKLMNDARDAQTAAPTDVPAVLKNAELPAFFRANLGLAYARSLNNRRIHEEALDVLKLFNPEQVVDPAAYLFNRAVSEFSLLQKDDANRTIRRLLEEAGTFSPERYKAVAMLMQLDMVAWKNKDLNDIARKMKDVERRLDLARGGPKTQEKQKEIIARLDEIIKKLENQAKSQCNGNCNGGNCPGSTSGPAGGMNPSAPAATSTAAQGSGGTGNVDPQKLAKAFQEWDRLPPRQREEFLQNLTAGMSPRHQEAIRNYFKNIAESRPSASGRVLALR